MLLCWCKGKIVKYARHANALQTKTNFIEVNGFMNSVGFFCRFSFYVYTSGALRLVPDNGCWLVMSPKRHVVFTYQVLECRIEQVECIFLFGLPCG